MNKKITRSTVIAVAILGTVAIPIVFFIIKECVRNHRYTEKTTEVTKEGILRITDDGTTSMGSYWEAEILGDAIDLTDEYTVSKGFFTGTQLRSVFEFEAVNEGSALVLVRAMHTGDFQYTDIYSVTVDEKLSISYDLHSAEAVFGDFPDNGVFVRNGSEEKLTRRDIRDLTRYVCGEETDFPDISREELDNFARLEYEDSVCYFDTDDGKVCIIRKNDNGEFRSAYKVDEWLLPMLKENFG